MGVHDLNFNLHICDPDGVLLNNSGVRCQVYEMA
jgi:hypothetical protein